MSKRSARVTKRSASHFRAIEVLEQRAYLNGIELGTPISSPLGGLSPTSISMTTASGANADFNGDGKTDLVLSDFADNEVGLYLGSGNGTFQSPVTVSLPAVSTVHALPVAIADMNGDGKLDIVCGDPGNISIIPGDGAGGLGSVKNIATNVSDNSAIAVTDLNGDGREDIVTATAAGIGYVFPVAAATVPIQNPTVETLIQQPDGSFVQQNVSGVGGLSSMVVGDFNGDGRPDLAFTIQDQATVLVLLNNGDGNFGGATYTVGAGPIALVAADFNGDGKLDLAELNSGETSAQGSGGPGSTISFLAGNGDGTFAAAVDSPIAGSGYNISATMVATQLNSGDTLPDLLINAGGNSDNLPQGIVALSNGDGTFHIGTTFFAGGGTSFGMDAAKLNTGDTVTNIVAADKTGLRSLLDATGQDVIPPTASVVPLASAPALASPTMQFTVSFSDDKQIDAATISSNSISVIGPDGTVLPATLVSTNLANGPQVQATYQITFAGQYYGQYTVTAAISGTEAARDANGNALTSSTVGTFNILPPARNSFSTEATLAGHFPQTAKPGAKGPLAEVTVSAGLASFSRPADCVVTLAASPTSTFTSNSIILGQMERRIKAGAPNVTVLFKHWNYPTIPGNYFIVATTNSAANTDSSPSAISVQLPTVSLNNLWNGATSNIVRHGKIDFSFQVQNTGTAAASGTLLIDLVATSPTFGSIYPMTQKVRVKIAPGQKQMIHFHLVPKAVPSGSYDLSLTLNPLTGFEGTNFTSNTVTGTNSITL